MHTPSSFLASFTLSLILWCSCLICWDGGGQGSDVIPMYFFGNTSVLSVLKNSVLETLSRTYQVSITIFWGQYGLPIPRKHKVS
jgi:hypothetical protein